MLRSAVVALAVLPAALAAQQVALRAASRDRIAPPGPGHAVLLPAPALTPPVIDGRGDDPAWKSARVITDFREFDPVPNGDPRFRTEARITYDAHNLYFFVRAYDPHPDSIVALLSRRDVKTASDQIKIMIDSYDDRRTGFEFAVNPAGVKRDYYTYDDADEDESWDGVWDVATRIDSLGWTAEFRIPLSQIRYPSAPE
ncbi:MAG: carbohydrate binding family 9 domain-containing protein, partial [Gemmatimonadota bacterium]|nr:carbohydrate binding family 9 domain-containing protein [Gemmatimonadota bacterium]